MDEVCSVWVEGVAGRPIYLNQLQNEPYYNDYLDYGCHCIQIDHKNTAIDRMRWLIIMKILQRIVVIMLLSYTQSFQHNLQPANTASLIDISINQIINKIIMQNDTAYPHDAPPNPEIQYEHCPHCARNFFKGKLQFHLKLCTADNPMHLSPKKTPKRSHSKLQQSVKQSLSNQQKKCPHCATKLPSFLYEHHLKKCSEVPTPQESKQHQAKNNTTEINLKQKQEVTLPLIKKIAKDPPFQIKKEGYMVKLRDELRCFRKAEEINQVECTSCGRYFSKAASLRHVPICEQIKLKQKYTSLLKRGKKTLKSSMVQQQGSGSCGKRKKAMSCLQVKQQQQSKLAEK